jgi:hypothetical protein
VVWQDCYRFEETVHLLIGASNGKTEAVFVAWPGGDVSKLNKVLEENDQLLTTGKRYLNGAERFLKSRMIGLRGIE